MTQDQTNSDDSVGGDKITIGTITNSIVAAGRGSRVIYNGPEFSRQNYRGDIADLLESYDQAFVCRSPEIKVITAFLRDEPPGYLLLEGLPGYGKSALLAQLILLHEQDHWLDTSRPALLYYFIRQDGRRNTPETFLQAANSQLLTLLKVEGGVPNDLNGLRMQFSQLWDIALDTFANDQPLLLLIDGLDEMAVGEDSIADYLPANLGTNARVIISLRPLDDNWLQIRETHPLRKAKIHQLPGFTLADVEKLLLLFGVLEGSENDLAQAVLEITKGAPLFTRFVGEEVGRQGPQVLQRLAEQQPRGVVDYFNSQLKALEKAGGTDLARQVQGLLLVALEGLTAADLGDVLEEDTLRIERAIQPMRRFFLHGERLQFMHQELRRAVSTRFRPRQQRRYHRILLYWCRSYKEEGWPAYTPEYVLRNYVKHLGQAGDLDELFNAVKDDRFYQAQWDGLHDARFGLADLQLALQKAVAAGDAPRMVDFLLLNAHRIASLRERSPLQALLDQPGEEGLIHAWQMADTHQEERRVLWHLLLAGESLGKGDNVTALRSLQRLQSLKFPELSGADAWNAANLLQPLFALDAGVALGLAGKLLPRTTLDSLFQLFIKAGELHWAVQVAAANQAGRDRGSRFNEIAAAFADNGQADAARFYWRRAQQVITKDSAWDRAYQLIYIADRQAKSSYLAQAAEVWTAALSTIPQIDDSEEQADLLSILALSQAEAGQTVEAMATLAKAQPLLRRFDDEVDQVATMSRLGLVQALCGRLETAETTWSEAGQIAANLADQWQNKTTVAIAGAQIRAGRREKYRQFLQQYLPAGGKRRIPITDESRESIALTLAETGAAVEALQLAQTISDPQEQNNVLLSLAEGFIAAGDGQSATQALAALDDSDQTVQTLQRKAVLFQQLGQRDTAESAWREALRAIRKGEKAHWGLSGLAWSLAEGGQLQWARELWAEEFSTSEPTDKEENRAIALGYVGRSLYLKGEQDQAIKAWQSALAAAEKTMSETAAVGALITLAHNQVKAGAPELAQSAWSEAISYTSQRTTGVDRAQLLTRIAAVQIEAGLPEAAKATCLEARQSAIEPDPQLPFSRKSIMEHIASLQAKLDDWHEARLTIDAIYTEQSDRAAADTPLQNMKRQAVSGSMLPGGSTTDSLLYQGQVEALFYDQLKADALTEAMETMQDDLLAQFRSSNRCHLTLSQARLGDIDGAAASWITLAAIPPKFSFLTEQIANSTDLNRQGVQHLKAREFEEARTSWRQALQVAYLDHMPIYWAVALGIIAGAQREAGFVETAQETWSEAFQAALNIKFELDRDRTLEAIVRAQAGSGDQSRAAATAASIGDIEKRAAALLTIARTYSAEDAFQPILDLAEDLDNLWLQAAVLNELASLQAKAGARNEARATWAKAQRTAVTIDGPWPHFQPPKLSIQREWKNSREEILVTIAQSQIEAGFFAGALETSNLILSDREIHLPAILLALVEQGDGKHFKTLLQPCTTNLSAAYRACGAVALAYPGQVPSIVL